MPSPHGYGFTWPLFTSHTGGRVARGSQRVPYPTSARHARTCTYAARRALLDASEEKYNFALRPLGRKVQVINCAMNVIKVAARKQSLTRLQPSIDFGPVPFRKRSAILWFDVPIANINDRNLIHLDPPLAIFRVHAKNSSAVIANAEVIIGKICHAYAQLVCPHARGP